MTADTRQLRDILAVIRDSASFLRSKLPDDADQEVVDLSERVMLDVSRLDSLIIELYARKNSI